MNNYELIIAPYFKGDVDRYTINKSININRSAINQYSILHEKLSSSMIDELKKDVTASTLKKLLRKIVPYLHLDGKVVDMEDFIFVDSLNFSGNYFQGFHTDVEWVTFCESNGFQIWILLEEDEAIKPRGNMFLLETPDVRPGQVINIYEDRVDIIENCSGVFYPKVLNTFKSLDEINPKITYLNANIGEVFIMNPSLFHCSDPIVRNSSRRALNVRVVHKPTKRLKICNDRNNSYTNAVSLKHFTCKSDYCEIFESNKTLVTKYM